MGFKPEISLKDVKPVLEKLISIPSVSGSEHEAASYVKKFLVGAGFKVEEVAVRGCGPTIFAYHRFDKKGFNLLFYGHLDTVKPVKGWRYSPFKPKTVGNRLYGLGACDMKGGVSAILAASKKVLGLRLSGSLTVALVSDEELYSRGCYTLIRLGKLKHVDAALSAEPTGLDRMEVGRVGRVVYDIMVYGKSGHAVVEDYESNALVEASKLILNLRRLKGWRKNLTVLAMSGGTEFLSTPDSCRLVIDRRLKVGEEIEEAIREIKVLVGRLGLKSRFRVKLFKRPTPYMKPYQIDRKHPIVRAVEEACLKVKGFKPRKALGVCVGDENYLVCEAKIPTVTFGPKGGNEHAANEYVRLDSVVDTANIYLETAKILLNPQP
ncbi:MAG: hypothetical protein DRO36_03425 [Candidatus Hecatellales archaeon]|nr:MAG: hypothetical protein DRO36_03425 [Candidatus Hecatellales archaeon]